MSSNGYFDRFNTFHYHLPSYIQAGVQFRIKSKSFNGTPATCADPSGMRFKIFVLLQRDNRAPNMKRSVLPDYIVNKTKPTHSTQDFS